MNSAATGSPPATPPASLREAITDLRFLARGGSSDVFRGEDRRGRPVAAKVFRPEADTGGILRGQFLREIRPLRDWRHPHIIRLYDSEEDPVPWYSMELLEGFTLREHLARVGALTPAEAVRLVRGVVRALAMLHEEGYLHRDIKPSNILIDATGKARLADFGLTTPRDAEGPSPGFSGTFLYASPEALAGRPCGPGSDLYAVGLVLYECLIGRPYFSMPEGRGGRVGPSLEGLRGRVPDELRRLIRRLLDPDPASRPREAPQLRGTLKQIRRLLGPPPPEAAFAELVTLRLRTIGPLAARLGLLARAPDATRREILADPAAARELRLMIWELDRRTDRFDGLDDRSSVAGVEAWTMAAIRFLMIANEFVESGDPGKITRMHEVLREADDGLTHHLAWARRPASTGCFAPLAARLADGDSLLLPDRDVDLYSYDPPEDAFRRVSDRLEEVIRLLPHPGPRSLILQHELDGEDWVVALKGPGIRWTPPVREHLVDRATRAGPREFGGVEFRWPALLSRVTNPG